MNTGTGRLTQYSPLLSHPPHTPHILHTLFFPTECLQFEKCVQLGLCTAVPRKISEHEWYELYVSAPPDTDILEYMRDPNFERYDRAMSTLRRLYRSATTTSRLSAVRLVKVLSALQYPPRKLPVRASVAWVGGSRVDLPNIVGKIEGPPLASPVVVVKVSDPLSRLVKTAAAATAIAQCLYSGSFLPHVVVDMVSPLDRKSLRTLLTHHMRGLKMLAEMRFAEPGEAMMALYFCAPYLCELNGVKVDWEAVRECMLKIAGNALSTGGNLDTLQTLSTILALHDLNSRFASWLKTVLGAVYAARTGDTPKGLDEDLLRDIALVYRVGVLARKYLGMP